MKFSPHSRPSL